MNNIVRKTLLAGLGAVMLSEEAAKKVLNNLVKRGEMSENDAKKVVNNIVKKVQKGKAELSKKIESEVKKIVKKVHIDTLKDIESVEIKISRKAKKGTKKSKKN